MTPTGQAAVRRAAVVRGFGYGEHLLVWSWRRIVTGRVQCPVMAQEFADACSSDAGEVFLILCTFLKALTFASRRQLALRAPDPFGVASDERQVLTLLAAAQSEDRALFQCGHISSSSLRAARGGAPKGWRGHRPRHRCQPMSTGRVAYDPSVADYRATSPRYAQGGIRLRRCVHAVAVIRGRPGGGRPQSRFRPVADHDLKAERAAASPSPSPPPCLYRGHRQQMCGRGA
jgi:hypothetical protein